MASLVLNGNTSGSVTLSAPAVSGTTVLTLPTTSGTIARVSGDLGTPSSGIVTNLTGTASININGTVGATTPAAGTFTSLNFSALPSGLNLTSSYSYNDNNANTIGGASAFNNRYFNIIVYSNADKVTVIPFYPNGGAGVAWGWTGLDNDAGTWAYSTAGLTRTFTQAGTGGNTFSIVLASGNASGTIQRTAGTQSYTVYIQTLLVDV
jgi:hypothetical protein